jgi:hypothetical protein
MALYFPQGKLIDLQQRGYYLSRFFLKSNDKNIPAKILAQLKGELAKALLKVR